MIAMISTRMNSTISQGAQSHRVPKMMLPTLFETKVKGRNAMVVVESRNEELGEPCPTFYAYQIGRVSWRRYGARAIFMGHTIAIRLYDGMLFICRDVYCESQWSLNDKT